MLSVRLEPVGSQIETTGSGVLGSAVFSGGKRPALRYWWNTSALGLALSGSPRPAPSEMTTIAWWNGTLSGWSELPSDPKPSRVMFLTCEKTARSRPCDGLVDLNALSALVSPALCL